jgi:hypothetical protein
LNRGAIDLLPDQCRNRLKRPEGSRLDAVRSKLPGSPNCLENAENYPIIKALKKQSPLIVVVAAVVGSFVAREYFSKRPSTDKILIQTSNELNRTLPMMVDQHTRLDATFPGPGNSLTYKYTLVGSKASDLKTEEIKKWLHPKIIQNYKTHPDMQDLRDLSTVLNYHYFDAAGTFVLALEADPAKF